MVLLLFGCKDKRVSAGGQVADSGVGPVRDSLRVHVPDSSIAKAAVGGASLKVSAYLLYDDGTFSGFDVLNDRSKVLWNVIIGEGDAEKASHNTKLSLDGDLDSLRIRVGDKRTLFIDTSVVRLGRRLDFVLKETGCNEVYVRVMRNKKIIYNDTIPFHCGE